MIANQDLINSFQLIESRRARISPAEGDPDRARQQIISVLIASRNAADVQEFQCPMKNTWELSIFHALLKRYGIKAYRYRKQRQSTIMIRVSKRFLDETLWPIFNEVILDLQRCFDEIVRNLLPAIAASPYDISVIDHEHRAGEMCENCRKRLMEEVT